MALIPGYKNDIFISYVHDDNVPEIEGQDGWVKQFHQYLETKLTKHDKRIKIWRDDRDMDRSEKFDKTIEEAIQDSAIMLCLYSRRYPQSDYCKKELDMFYEKAKNEPFGIDVGNRSRILPVFMSNIHYSKWLEKLRGTSGFAFHDAIRDDQYGDPTEVTSNAFRLEMKNLRNALVRIFDDFLANRDDEDASEVKEQREVDTDTFTIYMAEVDDTIRDRRDGIIADLVSSGYNIITGDPSVTNAKDHEKQTQNAIDSAHLAVHMVSAFPGRKISDDPESRYIQKQVEIGLASKTPQLIWMSNDLDLSELEKKNAQHFNFLKGLEESTISPKAYEFVRSNEGELLMILKNHIKQLELAQEQEAIQESNDLDTVKVLLDTHIDDFKQAFSLKKVLAENNVEFIFNPEDGDPNENIKSLYDNISQANKFVFVYGNKELNEWVDIRATQTIKKLVQDYNRFGQDVFIYVAPPHKDNHELKIAQSPLVKVVDYSDIEELDENALNKFLAELKGSAK